MAVTIVKRPLAVVPAFNDIEFHATSDQFAVSDFSFYVTVTIVSYSKTFVYTPVGNQAGTLKINLKDIISKYVSNHYPFNSYGWQYVTDGIQDITVNIGEYYSGSIHSGTDFDFVVFNAALLREERAVYLPANYQVNTGRNDVWLNNLENGSSTSGRTTCRSDQDMTFYFLQTGTLQMTDVEITTYDSAGATIDTHGIANPAAVTFPAVGQDRYICINVGPSGLTNISSGLVTGGFPIITASVASYRIAFYARSSSGGSINYYYRYVDIDDCSPKYDTWNLFYLNRFGAFDFVNMYGNHAKTLKSNKVLYKPIHTDFEGSYENVGVGDETVSMPLSMSQRVLDSSYEQRQLLKSDWLTDFQIEALQDLITAPEAFAQLYGVYRKFQVEDTQYRFKVESEKLKSLEVNLSEGMTEARQNG